ncbi:MAG TPA: DUF1549 and DUF1553 domain-containing protein [Pirellulaceae bacterium]|nr:DUF1549 and DUF1553 domain-containing protein [Pirellulaceae bacterium]
MRRLAATLLHGLVALTVCAWATELGQAEDAGQQPVSFRRDVIPALTKAGCNAGACHGSFQGRGGFRLSLLGFDPEADYETIAVDSRGRRVLPTSPASSLLLLKATGAVPHGGGVRLTADQPAYAILHDYIAAGLPAPSADEPRIAGLDVSPLDAVLQPGESTHLQVTARWSDGSTRDVTEWALFDARDATATEVTREGQLTSLRPGKASASVRYLGQVASVAITTPFGPPPPIEFMPANYIDELVLVEWQRMGVRPTALCSDGEFLRRAHLDLIGTLPTADEVRTFLASTDPDKRKKLIDALLERPEYGDYWSLKWGDLLRVHRRYVGEKGLGSFGGWLRQSIRENKPLDQLAKELLTAQGNLFSNGPVAYFLVDTKPEELAETTAQLFLGVRLQCARCHHHPMEVWGQDDYYGLAAFFTRLEVRENGDKGRFGGMHIVRPVAKAMKDLQVASPPRLFGQTTPLDPAATPDVRQQLAEWLTAKDNPFFARNFANRYWAYLLGRGLVQPIDDMRATNPASNPALLDALSKDFAEHGYDAKHLLRTIANSRVYQLATDLAPEIDKDGALFTHHVPRRMPAEVLLDAINQVTGHVETFPGQPPGTRAISLPDPAVDSDFLTMFGRPLRNNPCECARESSPDLLQALHLINNQELQSKIAGDKGRLAGLIAGQKTDDQMIEELYLSTYARLPTAGESAAIRELAADVTSRKEMFEDLLWTLLNSPEFTFNH